MQCGGRYGHGTQCEWGTIRSSTTRGRDVRQAGAHILGHDHDQRVRCLALRGRLRRVAAPLLPDGRAAQPFPLALDLLRADPAPSCKQLPRAMSHFGAHSYNRCELVASAPAA
jgi:hypothetical protein